LLRDGKYNATEISQILWSSNGTNYENKEREKIYKKSSEESPLPEPDMIYGRGLLVKRN